MMYIAKEKGYDTDDIIIGVSDNLDEAKSLMWADVIVVGNAGEVMGTYERYRTTWEYKPSK